MAKPAWKRAMIYDVGCPGFYYGIWNSVAKRFQFGICEPSPRLAEERLRELISHDSKKYRFEAKRLTNDLIRKFLPRREADHQILRDNNKHPDQLRLIRDREYYCYKHDRRKNNGTTECGQGQTDLGGRED